MLQFLTYLFIAIYTATVIGIILVVILGNRNPLKTIPWVVVLIFAPVVGLVFYFFFGPMCVEAMPPFRPHVNPCPLCLPILRRRFPFTAAA